MIQISQKLKELKQLACNILQQQQHLDNIDYDDNI